MKVLMVKKLQSLLFFLPWGNNNKNYIFLVVVFRYLPVHNVKTDSNCAAEIRG